MWLPCLKAERKVLGMCGKNNKSILQMCMSVSVGVVKYFCSILENNLSWHFLIIAEALLSNLLYINRLVYGLCFSFMISKMFKKANLKITNHTKKCESVLNFTSSLMATAD